MSRGHSNPSSISPIVKSLNTPHFLPFESQVDARGKFAEFYNAADLNKLGLGPYGQANLSVTPEAGVIRGIHFQEGEAAQEKLVLVATGAVSSVAVDLRTDSFGQVHQISLTALSGYHIIPRGFAHGIQILEPNTCLVWFVSQPFNPQSQRTIHYADPDLAIRWPVGVRHDLLSARDLAGEPLIVFNR